MKRVFSRFKAVGLRHEGKSYEEIHRITGIPKSTLSYWCSGLLLKDSAKVIIQQRKADANRKARETSIKKAKWRNPLA